MEELSLKILRDAGLTLDWQTVCVGWRGFSLHPYYESLLRSEEVRDFAYDSLASAVYPDDQQALVGIIDANANGGFQDAMSRDGEILSAHSFVTERTAICKWRYAKMQQLIEEYSDSSWTDDEDLYCYYMAEIVRSWNSLMPANPIPEVAFVYLRKETFLCWHEELRSWLTEEQYRLKEMGQMAESSGALV